MLPVLITTDTEYSSGLYADGTARDWRASHARCIACEAPGGAVGIGHQMDVADRYGVKLVFFVDPMPALVWGRDPVKAVLGEILGRGHDVQLHLHTEWLNFADWSPVGERTGGNLADFGFEDQCALIAYAAGEFVACGAPDPVAFRAGNYGANDDTLRALAKLGIAFDTSFPPALPGSACSIKLTKDDLSPVLRQGVIELPIAAISGRGGRRRHAQVTALSGWELRSAIRHAEEQDWPAFTLVSHSFELFSRRNGRANQIVARRFEGLCRWLRSRNGVETVDFRHPRLAERLARPSASGVTLLPWNPLREALRVGEQALANVRYA